MKANLRIKYLSLERGGLLGTVWLPVEKLFHTYRYDHKSSKFSGITDYSYSKCLRNYFLNQICKFLVASQIITSQIVPDFTISLCDSSCRRRKKRRETKKTELHELLLTEIVIYGTIDSPLPGCTYTYSKKKDKCRRKGKGRCCCLGERIQLLAALVILHYRTILKNRMNSSFTSINLVQFILFFQSS